MPYRADVKQGEVRAGQARDEGAGSPRSPADRRADQTCGKSAAISAVVGSAVPSRIPSKASKSSKKIDPSGVKWP